ncbi:MAG: immunoglobulin-like domain-containing protein [Patescibacteria group bacterium]
MFTNSTSTNATTTALAISNVAAGSILKVNTIGGVIAAVAGTDYLTSSASQSKWATSTDTFAIYPSGLANPVVGIGTTTPRAGVLTLASSTRAQLVLSDGSLASDQWTERAINGNLYFATSSPSTFATSTTAALAIDANGVVTLGKPLSVASGGTGVSTFGGTNSLLYTTSANVLSSIAASTNGFVLAMSGGVPTWVATSSINNGVSSLQHSFGTAQTGALTIATTSDTNILLSVTNSGGTFTFTPSFTGTLADARVADNLTISGGTIDNTPIGATTPSTGVFTNSTSTNATSTTQNISGALTVTGTTVLGNATATNATSSNFFVSGPFIVGTSPFLRVSNTGFGTTTLSGLTISGSATSTSNVGINLSGGCFAINNVCVSSSAAASTDKWATSTDTFAIYPNGVTNPIVGIGTTTPRFTLTVASSTRAQLSLSDGSLTSNPWNFRSINGNLYIATSSASTFATSTGTGLTITIDGYVGVGTTSPSASLSTAGNLYVGGAGNSVFQSDITVGSSIPTFIPGKVRITNNPGSNPLTIWSDNAADLTFVISNGLTGGSTWNLDATSDSSAYGGNKFAIYDGLTGATPVLFTSDGRSGFGTSTPSTRGKLTIATSSDPQLVLSDGSLISSPWNFRSINGNLYLATSSPSTFATSTGASALTILANGNVGIGNNSPAQLLDLNLGNAGAVRLQSGTNEKNGYIQSAFSNFLFSSNAIFNGASWTYDQSGFASQVQTESNLSGNISFNNAISGTGGAGLTWLTRMTITTAGNVGIGTTSPFAKLAVQAIVPQTNPLFEVASTSNATKFLSVAGDGFGTTTLSGLTISGSATSTSNVGLNLTGGCFAINDTCMGSGSSNWTDQGAYLQPLTSTDGILVNSASSTITNLVIGNATSTNATTTNFAISGALTVTGTTVLANATTTNATTTSFAITNVAASSILKTNTIGSIIAAIPGVDYLTSTFREWSLTTNVFGQSALAPTTTQNIAVSGIGTSTFKGGLEAWRQIAAPYFEATSTSATSTFAGSVSIGSGAGSSVLQFGEDADAWSVGYRSSDKAFAIASSTDLLSNVALSIAKGGFSTTTLSGLTITGSASTTSNVGINLSGGCFAINNVCVSSSAAASTDKWATSTDTFAIYPNGVTNPIVGIGTTTPKFTLTVSSSTRSQIALTDGSLTQNGVAFRTINGNFYIATTSPSTFATSTAPVLSFDTNGTITLGKPLPVASGGTGLSSFGGTNSLLYTTTADNLSSIAAGTGGFVLAMSGGVPTWVATSSIAGQSMWSTTTDTFGIYPNGVTNPVVGIGTTTPRFTLSVASSTRAQLVLSDGSLTQSQWAFRSINGTLYIATSSPSTFATTSIAALSISGSGFGTTTIRGLDIIGQATTTSNVGYTISAGCYAILGVCLPSAADVFGKAWELTTNVFGQSALAPTTTQNIAVSGIGTSTFKGGLEAWRQIAAPYFHATSSTATSTFEGSLSVGTGSGDSIFQAGSDDNAWSFGYRSSDKAFAIASSTGLASNVALSIAKGGFSTTTLSGLTITGSASTTSNVGINLSVGCFAINNTCVGGSAAAAGTDKWATSTDTFAIYPNGLTNPVVGIGTTTPRFTLSVASSTRPQIALSDGSLTQNQWTFRSVNGSFYLATSSPSTFATSTQTALTITADGLVGVGTTSPAKNFSVAGLGFFGGTTGTTTIEHNARVYGVLQVGASSVFIKSAATSTFDAGIEATYLNITGTGATTTFARGIDLAGGCFSINNVCISSSAAASTDKWATSTDTFGIYPNGVTNPIVGIGTTTPRFTLTLASSTRAQLVLSDGSLTQNQWAFRAINGTFYLATSSASTFATTSIAALSIAGDGFGTTTLRGLDIIGQATSTSNVGFNITGGCFAKNNTCIAAGSGSPGGSDTFVQFNQGGSFGGNTYLSYIYTSNTNRLGVGSTTPFAKLSVHAHANDTLINNTIFAIASSTASATTTLFSVSNTGQTTIGDPTSTTNVDAPIQVGLDANAWTFGYASADKSFRVASSTTLATSSTMFSITKETGIGIGTTSPRWALTVSSSTRPQLAITDASLTSDAWTLRSINNNFYLATSSAATFATSTTAAISIDSSGTVTFGKNLATCIALTGSAGLCDGDDASGGAGASTDKWATSTDTFGIYPHGLTNPIVGIGTTTPRFTLTVASSTRAQIAISDGSLTADQWTFRTVNGNFYLSTSSPLTFATSSEATLSIIGGNKNGLVGIGTTSPFAKLSVVGGGDNGSLPSFWVATTSTMNANGSQAPLFVVTATTTGALNYARVAVGTTSPWGTTGGLRDQFTVDGRTYATWRENTCDFMSPVRATITATTTNVGTNVGPGFFCDIWAFNEDTTGTIEITSPRYPSYIQLRGAATAGAAAILSAGSVLASATTSPVLEAWVRTNSTVDSTTPLFMIGFTGSTTPGAGNPTADFGAEPWNGVYFVASSTGNGTGATWKAVHSTGGVRTIVNTGVATSSTQFSKMRVEVTPTTAYFLINGNLVAQITPGTMTDKSMLPFLSAGVTTGGTGTSVRNLEISLIRLWVDDPPGGIAGGEDALPPEDVFSPVDGADIAEAYLADDPESYIEGTLLSNSTTTPFGVRRSQGRYDSDILGAITTSPYMTMGDEASTTVRMALVGRVPVIVSDENGPIKIGSRVTSSSVTGVGMRAGRPGPIVGRAVAGFDPSAPGACDADLKSAFVAQGAVFEEGACIGRVMVAVDPGVDMSIGDLLQDAQDGILTLADALTALSNEAFEKGAELTKFVAGQIVAQLAVIEKLFAKEIYTEKLCVGEVCVTEAEFLEIIQNSTSGGGQSPNGGGSGDGGSDDGDDGGDVAGTSTPSQAPVITIFGANPAHINVGDTYADLGASVTDDVDGNLGITTTVDGVEMTNVTIDTSAPGEHTIIYSATDFEGNVGTATRTVIVEDPTPAPEPEPAPEPTPEPEPQP